MTLSSGHLELFANDPLVSMRFFTDVLNFELIEVQSETFVWLRCGPQEILLRPGRKTPPARSYDECGIALVLYTSDFECAVKELKERGIRFSAPDGSCDCATFSDPDGNWFQLVDPGWHH